MSAAQDRPSLTKKGSVLSFFTNSAAGESTQQNLTRQEIQRLIQKFNDVNGSIEIEVDHTNLNLIEYQKEDQKIKYDPQMMTAKLRKLQNRAQMNRAQMQIQNRSKRKMKKFNIKNKGSEESYKTIYDKYIKNRKISDDYDDHSDQESQYNQNQSKKVAYFSQLKRHPRILEFTMNRLEQKNKTMAEKQKQIKEKLLSRYKQSQDQIKPEYQELAQDLAKKDKQAENNPQSVVDSQFSKFFTKKSSENLNKNIRSIPRCNKMIEKQNKMLADMDEKSLSREGKKKLKSRLNQIIFNISKSQKTHHQNPNQTTSQSLPMSLPVNPDRSTGFALPKINTAREDRILHSQRYI